MACPPARPCLLLVSRGGVPPGQAPFAACELWWRAPRPDLVWAQTPDAAPPARRPRKIGDQGSRGARACDNVCACVCSEVPDVWLVKLQLHFSDVCVQAPNFHAFTGAATQQQEHQEHPEQQQ